MSALTSSPLSSCGQELESTDDCLGLLVASDPENPAELRMRFKEDGYVLVRGVLDPRMLASAREIILTRLADRNLPTGFSERSKALTRGNGPLASLLYEGVLPSLQEAVLGGPCRHYDFTWLRAMPPGGSTSPHADIVFMGRGTQDLCTAWVPLGSVDWEHGGLMLLERSHLNASLEQYWRRDVDAYCQNDSGDSEAARRGAWTWNGHLSEEPRTLRRELGGRWLVSEYEAGDVLFFTSHTVHASLTNLSAELRLSADVRYQRSLEPADERWVGPDPVGHGPSAKRGLIC